MMVEVSYLYLGTLTAKDTFLPPISINSIDVQWVRSMLQHLIGCLLFLAVESLYKQPWHSSEHLFIFFLRTIAISCDIKGCGLWSSEGESCFPLMSPTNPSRRVMGKKDRKAVVALRYCTSLLKGDVCVYVCVFVVVLVCWVFAQQWTQS